MPGLVHRDAIDPLLVEAKEPRSKPDEPVAERGQQVRLDQEGPAAVQDRPLDRAAPRVRDRLLGGRRRVVRREQERERSRVDRRLRRVPGELVLEQQAHARRVGNAEGDPKPDPARPQQRIVDQARVVGAADEQHALRLAAKPVQLREQRRHDLRGAGGLRRDAIGRVTLELVPEQDHSAPMLPVDAAGAGEQVVHVPPGQAATAARQLAHVHEQRARARGQVTGEQRLPRPRRPLEQDARLGSRTVGGRTASRCRARRPGDRPARRSRRSRRPPRVRPAGTPSRARTGASGPRRRSRASGDRPVEFGMVSLGIEV